MIVTCKNHPNLRWDCKDIAVNDDGSYNGCRNVFFCGDSSGNFFADECDCRTSDLVSVNWLLNRERVLDALGVLQEHDAMPGDKLLVYAVSIAIQKAEYETALHIAGQCGFWRENLTRYIVIGLVARHLPTRREKMYANHCEADADRAAHNFLNAMVPA